MVDIERQKRLRDLLYEYAREGREVQLFNTHGQTMFPIWSGEGGLKSDCALFPILRGSGDRCPKFTADFPMKSGETKDLGNGWIVMCLTFGYHETVDELRVTLEEADKKLLAMKQGAHGSN
jgi:hypothetical protein